MPTKELNRDQMSIRSRAAGQGGQRAGAAHQQDTAPKVSLRGYTTTLEETGPARAATNAAKCTGTGWPQVRERMGLSIFLFFYFDRNKIQEDLNLQQRDQKY